MEKTTKNELTLEEKRNQLKAQYAESLKIALDKLEKKEVADSERVNVIAKIDKEFDTLVNAISSNSKNIASFINTFRKDYYTSFYINIGDARTQTLKRQAKELKALEKQHKLEKENIEANYNIKFDLDAKDEIISIEDRVKYVFNKYSNGTINTPDYRFLIIENKAIAVIKDDGSPMLSSIQIPYTSNNIVKKINTKVEALIKECNKDLSSVPNANRISIEDLDEVQKKAILSFFNKKKIEISSKIKTDLGGM